MKKKIVILGIIFSSFLLTPLIIKPVAAVSLYDCCDCSCGEPACRLDCSRCGAGGSGVCPKVINPFLSEDLQAMNGVDFIGTLIPNIITVLLTVAALASLIFLLLGGIKWITAGGDREGIATAQKMVTGALIGLFLTFSVFAIMELIGVFFGIDLINFNITPLIL